jgi:hypothetical protein
MAAIPSALDAALGGGDHFVHDLFSGVGLQVAVQGAFEDGIVLGILNISLSFFQSKARQGAGLH